MTTIKSHTFLALCAAFVLAGLLAACHHQYTDKGSPFTGLHKEAAPAGEFNTESYGRIVENEFMDPTRNPFSTFSIDVDAAAYANVRRFLNLGQLPPEDAVRIEELVNYFTYSYPQPEEAHPFSINTEFSRCPWAPDHQLVHVGLQGKEISAEDLPPSNLVFLIDVSGSMSDHNKLPLLKQAFGLLVDQLREEDRVSIAVYAGASGLVLEPTPGSEKWRILEALDRLEAGGGTAGAEGIELAYATAEKSFLEGGNNRVILATDGDFNIGLSSDGALERLIEEKRESGVFLTVLGFGTGNYKDSKMQTLADKGNGNHAYIDNLLEARKVLVNEFGGTLFTIAKDVKLQVEFNPALVKSYRLIGYENRILADTDFDDDRKDAGELGSGHSVTALYEIIPANSSEEVASVAPTRYQANEQQLSSAANRNELMHIKFRYKQPDGDDSRLLDVVVPGTALELDATSDNFRWSAAVAEFGLVLRNSKYKADASYDHVLELAQESLGEDYEGYRQEFIGLVKKARMMDNRAEMARK